MNEEPKSIWEKSWKGPRAFLFWLLVVSIAAFVGAVTVTMTTFGSTPLFDRHRGLENFVGCTLVVMFVFIATVAVAFIFYGVVRWLFCWSNLKRTFFATACLITLIALFYAEEDWRGWHAWNQFKHEWEAKGEKFNLADFVPPPVPDEQNFALAPIWVEHIKATLGPKRAHQWYGDKFPDNGRTNFTERLLLEIWHHSSPPAEPETGDWRTAERVDLKAWQVYFRVPNDGIIMPGMNRPIPMQVTNEFPVMPQPQSPAQDVLLALSKHDAAIEDLRQASRLLGSRFPLEYDSENPASILLPHLAALKRGSIFLKLHAIAALENNQSEKAFDDVKLSLRLTDSVRTEPILISHLVRLAMLQLTLQPVYEGLADHRWSNAQLIALDAELAKLDFLADYEFCQRSELAFIAKDLEYRRRTRDPEYLLYADYGNGNSRNQLSFKEELRVFAFRHCPGGWFYQNLVRYGRFALENYLPILDASHQLAFPASAKRANDAARKEVAHLTPYNFMEQDILYPIFDLRSPDGLAEKFVSGQTSVNLGRTAIALERYRLAHGEFPESLDALAPQFIAQVSHDVIGGQPLKYRRTADGQFVLYSIGWNERDDGGVVVNQKSRDPRDESSSKVDISLSDWVWRYPAK